MVTKNRGVSDAIRERLDAGETLYSKDVAEEYGVVPTILHGFLLRATAPNARKPYPVERTKDGGYRKARRKPRAKVQEPEWLLPALGSQLQVVGQFLGTDGAQSVILRNGTRSYHCTVESVTDA